MNWASEEWDVLRRQLSWTQAALDLCLDMERNQSDSHFARSPDRPEIVYTFDEDVFELFVGGFDEQPGTLERRIYHDRRRSIGIFNTHEWRESAIGRASEEQRILINRQSAILASEWLFSGRLPGMKAGRIYMSGQHMEELYGRWRKLITYYRQQFTEGGGQQDERKRVEQLSQELPSRALNGAARPDESQTDGYIISQDEPLRSDLRALRAALGSSNLKGGNRAPHNLDFWRYAYNRRLASTLAGLRTLEPIAQLMRIHGPVSRRLEILDVAMDVDDDEGFPSSETTRFWLERLSDEYNRRSFGDRTRNSLAADADTLAWVQALANNAVRSNERRRFVFVTSDALIIDVYRKWHCNYARPYEPFVLRRVRQYAPLLNIKDMAGDDGNDERALKSDIFKRLRRAIEPFLLPLNLSVSVPQPPPRRRGFTGSNLPHQEDMVRWAREHFAIKMSDTLAWAADEEGAGRGISVAEVMDRIADVRFFPDRPFSRLPKLDAELAKIADLGRAIERAVIGFDSRSLAGRLKALARVADASRKMGEGDESALATYIQGMVDEFGVANLEFRVRLLNIASELHQALRGLTMELLLDRVPLTLKLTYVEEKKVVSIAGKATSMIPEARQPIIPSSPRRTRASFDGNWANTSIGNDGGYRLFALYCCIALQLSQWDVAFRCAVEALQRGRDLAAEDRRELEYLVALSTRFRIGAGPIMDAGQADVTAIEFAKAETSLTESARGRLANFVEIRAASELVSLKLFGCAWSLSNHPMGLNGPSYPAGFDPAFRQVKLSESLVLLNALIASLVNENVGGREFKEARQQVAVNLAAASCLAVAASSNSPRRLEDYVRPMRDPATAFAWLDDVARGWDSAEGWRPPVAGLILEWYLYLRKLGRAPTKQRDAEMILSVDKRLAALLRQGLSEVQLID